MGKLDPNSVIGILRGKIGDLVFAETTAGKVIVRHKPKREAPFRIGELANQSLFAQASAYVKRIRPQPDLYAPYQQAAKSSGKRACDLANADFRHPPVIEDVDVSAYQGQPGQVIGVRVTDDFEVVAVHVVIAGLDGAMIEQGAAALDRESGLWLYSTRATLEGGQTVAVHVNAADRAGNVVTKSIDQAIVQ
jgi:hypothetical protein